ncbi:hypothetical protein [Meiothermus rufus]|uniref:hypothetical protein n=1 Tax=Meiothermus rufus TaxID=604332 RepID=UPI00042A8B71|nr:hypothetical protein [Meiothermus rufus]
MTPLSTSAAMPPRYPHLPGALHRLLEAGPWQGTPTELYATLEAHRVEPWPANPVSLSLWLKHHAKAHGVQVEAHHTGERRVLRLARGANGLKGATIPAHSGTIPPHTAAFWSFPTWAALLETLPRLEGKHLEEVTLAFDLGSSRTAQTIPAGWLPQVVERWAAQYPQPREVRVYPGVVEVSTVWPLGKG